jgi:hypothetical protein
MVNRLEYSGIHFRDTPAFDRKAGDSDDNAKIARIFAICDAVFADKKLTYCLPLGLGHSVGR